jgi:transcriptional regulator GlxA family with amidase domain
MASLWRTALQQDGHALQIAPRASIVAELFRARTFADVIDWANDTVRRMGRDAGALPPESKRALRQVRKYVHGSLAQKLSSVKVARKVGIDPGELDRMLRHHFNITFRQYLTMERLTLARKLLRESNLTVTEIAATTGFSDQSNFTKTFEKLEGISPTQYRLRSIRAEALMTDHMRVSEPRKP